MAKAKAEITIFNVNDVKSVTRYYLLQSSTAAAPSKPTTITPGGNWKTTEPSYTDGSTNTLYFVDLTIMSDGKTFSYSDVSKSSSYEAAKSAWNKANNAQNTANDISAIASKSYTINGASGKAEWVRFGRLTSGGDSSIFAMSIQTGNGFNGGSSQNSQIDIVIKDGWQSSASAKTAFGASVTTQNCGSDVKVKIMATAHNVCDVWVYLPWGYWNGVYTISGRYSTWDRSVAIHQTGEPAASDTYVAQSVGFRTNAEDAKSAADSANKKLEAKVNVDSVISAINASAETITIEGKKVNLKGAVTFDSFDSATQTKVNNASTNASNAVSTANTAKSTADSASKAASEAKSTAASAVSTAATANTNASNAVSTANSAKSTADNASKAAKAISDNIYTPNTTTIDGAKITTGSIKASQIDVANLFAQDIKATGSISGVTINAEKGYIGGWGLKDSRLEGSGYRWAPDGGAGRTMMTATILDPCSNQPIQICTYDANNINDTQEFWSVDAKDFKVSSDEYLYTMKSLKVSENISTSGNYYRNGNRIGETITGSNTNAKAVANGTWTNTGASIKLPAGVYMVIGTVIYASAKGGRRGARFANGSNGIAYTSQVVSQDSAGSANAYIQCQWILTPDAETTYNLQAFQSTGANLNVTASYIKAVRIA